MAVLSIPGLLLILLLVAVVLLLWKKRIACAVIIIILILLNWWAECIPFRLWAVNAVRGDRIVKVMSFNISGTATDIHSKALGLAQLIFSCDPDIVFIAEISNKNKPVLDSLMKPVYPYTAFTNGYAHCFYSKRMVSGWRKLENDSVEHLGVYACMLPVDNDSITFYGCHFASNNYNEKQQYITPDSINNHKEFKTYMSDIKRAYRLRAGEASILAREVVMSKLPIIVMGDFNDVGGSAAVKTLENVGLEDAWWKGGFGYGATIFYPLPYRIDHILYSKELKLANIKVVDSEGLSDHDALYAEFEI